MLAIGGAVTTGLRIDVPNNASAAITLTDLPADAGQRMVSADPGCTCSSAADRASGSERGS